MLQIKIAKLKTETNMYRNYSLKLCKDYFAHIKLVFLSYKALMCLQYMGNMQFYTVIELYNVINYIS